MISIHSLKLSFYVIERPLHSEGTGAMEKTGLQHGPRRKDGRTEKDDTPDTGQRALLYLIDRSSQES